MDWADEQASAIYGIVTDNFAEETPAKIRSRIAFDLRKAKADGMREVVKKADSPEFINSRDMFMSNPPQNVAIYTLINWCIDRASQIERGEI